MVGQQQQPPWVLAALAVASCSSLLYVHYRIVKKLETKWIREREAERVGRIRAEVKLRTASKQTSKDGDMNLKRIGKIVSPFTKRMGTPRQGALVPSSRAFVHVEVPMETLDGIEQYSHAWIIFEFHANTDMAQSKKTKIRPPRGGGIKVGQLSTRSPHRPNALGLSLVKIDRLDPKSHRLYVSAIDLVNGTPVYDIKPCVPWDVPGKFDGAPLQVPLWVDSDDTLFLVDFSPSASHDLQDAIEKNLLSPLYTTSNDGFKGAKETIKQVLAQDPRASHKRGTSTGTKESAYKIVFCRAQVEFRVIDGFVEIVKVDSAQFDDAAFVDGIPLSKPMHQNGNA